MVRFIIHLFPSPLLHFTKFTFQYGQIYYLNEFVRRWEQTKFTFQYGQIYYPSDISKTMPGTLIYIPIWLDLLFIILILVLLPTCYLHSNMVRFIIRIEAEIKYWHKSFTFQYGQIYYNRRKNRKITKINNLHSNMVRFIIRFFSLKYAKLIFSTY